MSIENVIGLVALVGLGIVVGLAYRKWKESKSTPVREPIVLPPVAQPKKRATKAAPAKKAAPVAKYATKKTATKKKAKAK